MPIIASVYGMEAILGQQREEGYKQSLVSLLSRGIRGGSLGRLKQVEFSGDRIFRRWYQKRRGYIGSELIRFETVAEF